MASQSNKQHNHQVDFPWKHVIGFLFSIVLTILAVWIAFLDTIQVGLKVTILFAFAFIQMGVQLFLFMHIGEGKDGKWQIGHTLFAIVIAVIITIGSYWVIMSGHL